MSSLEYVGVVEARFLHRLYLYPSPAFAQVACIRGSVENEVRVENDMLVYESYHAFGTSVSFCAVRICIVAMCMQFLAYSRTLQQRFPASVFTTTMQMQCVGMVGSEEALGKK